MAWRGSSPRALSWLTLSLSVGVILACGDDGNNGTQPPPGATYADVNATLVADCGGCHGAGRIFLISMDSAELVNSGLINPSNPAQSLLILKPTNATPHGGGTIGSFTAADRDLVSGWIALQPAAGGGTVTAVKIPAGTAPPVVNGYFDPAWNLATQTSYIIGGGWADATSVQVTAVYDDTYLYLRVRWADDQASIRRQPWVKQADGTWRALPAKTPLPDPGMTWAQYMGQSFNEEDNSRFNYEDKLAIMWNTYGASTVAGFDQSGCAVTCHDPAAGNAPGSTYNYADESVAAKKYTNAAAEIADLWHWKLVRNNQHYKMDDQFVRYWVPGPTGAAEGGRASDAGAAGYGSNPAINGRPTYRGPTADVPPYYIFDAGKVALTDDEVAAFPVGKEIPNMITSGPTLTRADVDGFGFHNSGTGYWVIEIRRMLVTGDANDVQFDDLTRQYSFGVAVFDNAQIEHSYMSVPGKLVFQP